MCDHDGKRILAGHGIAVSVFGAVIDVDADPGELFNEKFSNQAGMPRGATGENHYLINVLKVIDREVELAENDGALFFRQSTEDCFLNGPRLVKDFLQHEMLVTSFFGHDGVPLNSFGCL